jgi:hypothetical protein
VKASGGRTLLEVCRRDSGGDDASGVIAAATMVAKIE